MSITITNPGSGYSSPPTVTFSGGGDSSAAAATAAITIPSAGGLSSEVDFGNLNLDTTVQVDVNGFLGNGSGQVPDTTADFDNMSTTIASHEIGHTLGLEHMDSFSPIGFGISSPPGADKYYPAYAGLVGAFATVDDVMASPASVGSTLEDAADGQAQFGARDAISLAFITDGTTVGSNTSGPAGWNSGILPATVPASPDQVDPVEIDSFDTNETTTVYAQPVSLYTLSVPDSITSGFDSDMKFAVSAVNIDGYLGGTTPVSGNVAVPTGLTANTAPLGMADYYTTGASTTLTQSAPITTASRVKKAS